MARIRIYSPYFPFPHTEAAFQMIFNQIKDCRGLGHDVELVTWKDAPELLKMKQKDCGNLWPEGVSVTSFYAGQSSGWADRVLRVVKSLWTREASPELFYYPPSADRRDTLDLVDLEIYHYSFAHVWLQRQGVRARHSAVQFHNLEHSLFDLRAKAEGGLRSILHKKTSRKLKRHEAELKDLVTELWQISPADLERYTSLFGPSNQRLVPPTIDQAAVKHRWSTPRSAGPDVYKLGFIGGLNFVPNQESFRWILNNVAPLLAEHDSSRFEIIHVGKRDPDIEASAKRFPFIRFLGFIRDVEDWWEGLSYTMVPDMTGAGIRVKLLESLGSKVPVLTNTQAVNRIPQTLHSEPGLSTSDDAADWIKKILSSSPFEERARLRSLPFPSGLDGRHVFAFLNEGFFNE